MPRPTEPARRAGESTPDAPAVLEAALSALEDHGLVLVTEPVRAADPAAAAHLHAVERGFYEKVPTGEHLRQVLEGHEADGRRRLDVHPAGADPATARPVATFEDFRSELTVCPGRTVDAWLVSAVTVDPGHRRRGILRAMMARSLADAVAAGVPVAALTASEAPIYGRFGFGAASRWRRVHVDVSGDVALNGPAPGGTVTREEPREMPGLVDDLYQRVRRMTPGTPQRTASYVVAWEDRSQGEEDGKGSGLYGAVHRDAAGVPCGVVLYRPLGWDHEPPTVKVTAFLAATPDARRALVAHLASLDLIRRVDWGRAPNAGWLEALLEDQRRVRTVEGEDDLHLRILDVPAALGARDDLGDGHVVLRVRDALGHAAGTWSVEASGGRARVAPASDANATLTLDVAQLSALWLGGHGADGGAAALAATGLLEEHAAGAADALDAMLRPTGPVQSLVGF